MNWNSQFWLAWNWFTCIPLIICVLYRFFTREDYVKVGLKTYTLDYIARLMIVPAVIYYLIDSYHLLSQPGKLDWCNFAFLFHHVVTMGGFRASLTIPHFPWFFLACFASHCLLIMFPYQTNLNYIYLLVLLTCFYGLMQPPFKYQKLYKEILYVAGLLVIGPIIMLWWFECKNDMLNV
ncbi:hypothetical protein SteCoe_17867 [Stentor coeruleus]|uniref:Transmembrane protein n=1 Tax=Stentor coeruleus TaxID=5963 RepID=A0A1R2BY14_9CILI|nr:hypothetical protein SteCoe_17867 [Stentor coeruleus]